MTTSIPHPRPKTAVLLAACIGFNAIAVGCCNWKGALLGAASAVGTYFLVKAAGGNDTEAVLAGIGVGVVVCGLNYYVVKKQEEREATQKEIALAEEKAKKNVEKMTVAEANIIEQDKAKFAVVVEETPDSKKIVIVDPKTKKPVRDENNKIKTITIPNSEIDKMDTVADAQKEADESLMGNKKGLDTTNFNQAAENAEAQKQGKPLPHPTVEKADPQDLRVGKIGDTNVILRSDL